MSLRPPSRAVTSLLLIGALTAALYTIAAVRLSLPRYFGHTPPGSAGLLSVSGGAVAWYAVTLALAFVLYGLALAAAWSHQRLAAAVLFGFPLLFALALAWMYPPTTSDLLKYQADARTFWVFHDNPLVVPPSAHPYPVRLARPDEPSVYGPVWTLLAGPATLAAGDHLRAGLVLLKLLAAASYLLCAWLVYRIAAGMRPGWEAFAVVAFAWNPFVVMRTAGGGHNDLWMMLFALAALERARRRDWTAAFPALALSVLVKYATALLVPMLLAYAWQHAGGNVRARGRALLPGLAAALVVAALVLTPLWAGRATFTAVTGHVSGAGALSQSVPQLVAVRLSALMTADQAAWAAEAGTRLLFLVLYVPLVWQARRDFPRLVVCGFTALFLFLAVAAAQLRPAYLLWPLALAALAPGTWLAPIVVALSLSAAATDLAARYGLHWNWLRADEWRALAVPVVVALAPPILVWYAGLIRFRTWRLDVPEPVENRPAPQ